MADNPWGRMGVLTDMEIPPFVKVCSDDGVKLGIIIGRGSAIRNAEASEFPGLTIVISRVAGPLQSLEAKGDLGWRGAL